MTNLSIQGYQSPQTLAIDHMRCSCENTNFNCGMIADCSGVGAGNAGVSRALPRVLICRKSGQIAKKHGKNPLKLGHRCFDSFVLFV